MRRTAQTIALWGLVLLGLWGCSQGPNQRTALIDRIKALEAKNARLDADLRAATSARDQLSQQLIKFDEMARMLQVVARERDELKVELKIARAEREQAVAQFDGFRQTLREALGRADAAVKAGRPGSTESISLKTIQ